ncbi:MAG: hypothetical protein ABIS86_01615 [Streptosporangiaceae bacterium]
MNNPWKHVLAVVGVALVAGAAWYGWLGWDQSYDEHPDGTVSGPYQAWQVVGLVLTLVVPLVWAVSQRYFAASTFALTFGLTVASFIDWSDDESGLFLVGVLMIMIGGMFVTSIATVVLASLPGLAGGRRRPRAGVS